MRTDELIGRLATGLEPAPRRAFERRLAVGLAIGLAIAVVFVRLAYGLRGDLVQAMGEPMMAIKFAFPATVGLLAIAWLRRLATPGMPAGGLALAQGLPFAAMAALAGAAWLASLPGERLVLLLGETWMVCSVSIVLGAMPALAATHWALRRAAPTDLPRAGAAAGLLSGSAGAIAYALHCPELAAPFLLVWNGLGMLACAALGAAIAPRVLRW